MNNFYSVFNDTGEGQPPRRSLKTDAKKAASSGERQLPSRCPRPEQTRRKHLDGRRENGYLWGEANDEILGNMVFDFWCGLHDRRGHFSGKLGAAIVGAALTWVGWKIHQKRGDK